MAVNICLCGAEAGYPHAADCPRPLFRGSEQQAEQWESDRLASSQRLRTGRDAPLVASQSSGPVVRPPAEWSLRMRAVMLGSLVVLGEQLEATSRPTLGLVSRILRLRRASVYLARRVVRERTPVPFGWDHV